MRQERLKAMNKYEMKPIQMNRVNKFETNHAMFESKILFVLNIHRFARLKQRQSSVDEKAAFCEEVFCVSLRRYSTVCWRNSVRNYR